MNSCVPPFRKIASNGLWTPDGVMRHPLVTLSGEGCVIATTECVDPDRQPFTEFYAGLLVADFPVDYRTAFDELRAVCGTVPQTSDVAGALSLDEALRHVVPAEPGCLVVLSGLEYAPLRLTPQSRIRLIAAGDAPRPSGADVRGRGGCRFRS